MFENEIVVDTVVTPILKWVGGKRELIPEIKKYYCSLKFNRYIEPFFGGGSVYLDVVKTFGKSQIENSIINDLNGDMINMIRDIKTNPKEVIQYLHELKSDYEKYGFYFIRDRFNGVDREGVKTEKYSGTKRSSSLIVLNRTCFNGLYRINSKGLFNVPEGRYKNPKIINEGNIYNFSETLPQIENIRNGEFNSIKEIQSGDLVYFDPPYHPITKTSSFTSYSGEFGEVKQRELYNYFKFLDDNGVFVIQSNSSSDLIYDLYKEFSPNTVYCSRMINSVSSNRGKVPELIIVGNTLKKELEK